MFGIRYLFLWIFFICFESIATFVTWFFHCNNNGAYELMIAAFF